jgi:hypothetical protein
MRTVPVTQLSRKEVKMLRESLSRRNLASNRLVLFTLTAITTAAAPQALKAAENPCPLGNAALHGTYMVHGSGTVIGLGPVASNGMTTFDGKGHAINTFSASINGEIHRGVTVGGTYTVNPDCTGTRFASDGSTYDFVVMPDGSTFNWIEVDDGTVISGSAVRFKE